MQVVSFFKKLCNPIKLVEHIPGEKRVYKNFYGFGKTVRTIERIEECIDNIDKNKALEHIKTVADSALNLNTKNAINKLNELAAMGKPITATSLIVTDKNGYIERANSTLKSGAAFVRYETSFKNGDFATGKTNIRHNF